jgi:DNA-directed RNA polymerase subunit RPC12/RpoP
MKYKCPKCGSTQYTSRKSKRGINWRCKKCGYKKINKTAKQLLKENPITGKLKRDINKIEKKYEEEQARIKGKKKNKNILKTKTIINRIQKKFNGITSYYNNYEHVIKHKKKNICYIAQRKYGVAVTLWKAGMKNYWTERVVSEKDIENILSLLEERIND